MTIQSRTTLNSWILFSCTALAMLGCDRAPGEAELNKLTKELKNIVEGVTPSKEVAEQELEKLFSLEYQVLTFPSDVEAKALQDGLRRAGMERWDCFHVESRQEELLVLCKRQPKTYLRYIPRVF